MATQRDFSSLGNRFHQYSSHPSALPILSAAAIIVMGGAILFAMPDNSDKPQIASATANTATPASTASAPETGAADDSLCDKQAWPYIDQRCAQRVEAARGTRQVRIVTDKGNSVNVVTPVPIVEAKPKPAPQPPVTVAKTEPVIGPPVVAPTPQNATPTEKVAVAPQPQAAPAPAPTVQAAVAPQPAPPNPAPQPQAAPAPTVQAVAAPANPPAAPAVDAMARETRNTPARVQNAVIEPAAASPAPMNPGVEALDEMRPKKSKAAEKREAKREAKEARREARRKAIEEEATDGVPDDVVTTVRALPSEGQSRRRARNAVPDEVLAAVEQAARESRGGRSGRTVVVGSPSGGQRIYLVPADQGGW